MIESTVPGYTVRRGKVRDVYEVSPDRLVLVATDRISAHDFVLPNTIPDKGKILTQLSIFWADRLSAPYHLINKEPESLPPAFRGDEFHGRTMLVDKARVVPFECVVRGYLCGSAWEEYKKTGSVLDHRLPPGLKQNMALPTPIFTPATKAETGHDINVRFLEMAAALGCPSLASELERRSLDLYTEAAQFCWERGLILADTKFEWGHSLETGDLLLIDEVLTPDSSRYWPVSEYALGCSLPSYDKQSLRGWLNICGWDKESPPPPMPAYLAEDLADRYKSLFEKLTGHSIYTV